MLESMVEEDIMKGIDLGLDFVNKEVKKGIMQNTIKFSTVRII
jgi:hypothetical protein